MKGVTKTSDSSLLFFILVFLLLFYDGSFITSRPGGIVSGGAGGDSSILFFILVFLILFYK